MSNSVARIVGTKRLLGWDDVVRVKETKWLSA